MARETLCTTRTIERKPGATNQRSVAAVTSVAAPSPARALQQRLGNRGTRAFAAQVVARTSAPGVTSTSGARTGQLSISQPGDVYEQEADRVSEAVMRMPASVVVDKSAAPSTASPAKVQRLCTECEEEQKHKAMPQVQRKEQAADTPQVTPAVSASIGALKGGGSPLPTPTRAFFEPRFGADFSQVRVHTNTHAARTASSINAKAFTVGQDIAFGAGQYAPQSSEGQRLLAHELTHVVQQNQESARRSLHRSASDFQIRRQIDSGTNTPAISVMRQVTASPGVPGGPDPCLELIEAIIRLLNEVWTRFNHALDDKNDLFKWRPGPNPDHPEGGTWDGHRQRFYKDRGDLKYKVAEWDSNDDCRGFKLSKQQQEELQEAREFAKEYPERPARAMREAQEEGPSYREKIRDTLLKVGVPAFAVGALVVLIIAALADPEPISKVALLIGSAAAVALFILIGRSKDAQSDRGTIASTVSPPASTGDEIA